MTTTRKVTDPDSTTRTPIDVDRIRQDFPILGEKIHGNPLVYLDNAASTQKPEAVINAVSDYYRHTNANIHRGVHHLSQKATQAYENTRGQVQRFIGAAHAEEIIFTAGTTESINLVASSFGRTRFREGDEIVISTMEHHSNIVPWQLLCEQTGAVLRVVPISDSGELLLDEYEALLGPKTRLVSIVHTSNALGTINPVNEIVTLAHAREIPVLFDGAQAVAHNTVDVQEINCDFFAFSGHKIFGPTGVGVLYGKKALLESMPPYQGGGDMIESVSFEKTTYAQLPNKLEAGTPNIAGVIGLGEAIRYVEDIGLEDISAYETMLLDEATERVAEIKGLRLVGTAAHKASVLSFVFDDIHPHDIGTILDQDGVAVRAGHHCAEPLMDRLGVPATVRASFALYNTREEIDALVRALRKVTEFFG
jgi:cysteine desulfurase/selenocysteine lyase